MTNCATDAELRLAECNVAAYRNKFHALTHNFDLPHVFQGLMRSGGLESPLPFTIEPLVLFSVAFAAASSVIASFLLLVQKELRKTRGAHGWGCSFLTSHCVQMMEGMKPMRSVHKNLEEFVHLLLPLAVLMEFSKEKEEK